MTAKAAAWALSTVTLVHGDSLTQPAKGADPAQNAIVVGASISFNCWHGGFTLTLSNSLGCVYTICNSSRYAIALFAGNGCSGVLDFQ
jgi:hypothetical protein